MNKAEYILWLPSWYPNKFEPLNGDFIQRHAEATSLYIPITLIHFTQLGETVLQPSSEEIVTTSNQLKEIISYLKFKPTGVRVLDKCVYNLKYYQHAKRLLNSYFNEYGLPIIVHVHIPMKSGNLALWIKRKYGVDYIVSEHSSYYMREAPRNFFERHILYRFQTKRIFQKAALVTNVSATIGRILARIFCLKKVITIHNVVNTKYFTYSKIKGETFTYIHVSSLSDQKNIIGILKTFKRLKNIREDWRLMLVGPYTEILKSKVNELCLQNHVEFTGEVSYEQVSHYMKHSHVKVLFSKHENFPCTIIEALCCGVLVVAPDIAGVSEAVNESNGMLVRANNEEDLLSALIRIREAYSNYDLERISQAAVKKYQYNVIGKQIFNLYNHSSIK